MPVEVVPGIRRRTKCFYGRDGHSYHVNKFVKGGRVSLRCSLYASRQCHGRASCSRRGLDFKQNQEHNHGTEPQMKEAKIFREAVLSRCRSDGTSDLATMYHEERRRLRTSPEAAALYPLGRLRTAMQRARHENLPNIPHTLSELKIIMNNPQYSYLSKSVNSEGSVYAGTFGRTSQGTRCTVFASKKQLKYLRRCRKIFCDATFDSIPAGLDAAQVWNVTTIRRRRIIPLARIIMQTKSAPCYAVGIQALKQLAQGFSPTTCNCDFEIAQAKEMKRAFPNCRIRGCLFHFTKNIVKRARQLGLDREMREDEEICRLVRMVCALPLLPTGRIEMGLTTIGRRAVWHGRYAAIQPFLHYVCRTWLAPSRLQILSVHGATDRTSNVCESDNARLARSVRAPHPCFWKFLGGVVEMADIAELDIATLNLGLTPSSRQRRASALANDDRIKAFQEELEAGDISISTFLRRASRRLQGAINKLREVQLFDDYVPEDDEE